MADLAPHRTTVDQDLRSIDIASPLVRHVSRSPALARGDIGRRFQSQMRLDHGFIARPRAFSPCSQRPSIVLCRTALRYRPCRAPAFRLGDRRAVRPSKLASSTAKCSPSPALTRAASILATSVLFRAGSSFRRPLRADQCWVGWFKPSVRSSPYRCGYLKTRRRRFRNYFWPLL